MHRMYLHPLPLRIWHWINALGMVTLALTGIQIRYVGMIDVLSFHTAVVVHNYTGFVIIANFCLWLLFHLFTDQARNYHSELSPTKLFKGSLDQLIYYGYGMFKGQPNPYRITEYHKFNPLQALTYQFVMFIWVPIQMLTGLLLWDVTRFGPIVDFVGGVRVVDTVHVLIFTVIVLYIPLHAYLATLGHTPTEHIKAMITGYEDVEDEPGEKSE